MTIDEAIANLIRYKDAHHSLNTDVIGQSMTLGIEALGQFVILRKALPLFNNALLPGETEK